MKRISLNELELKHVILLLAGVFLLVFIVSFLCILSVSAMQKGANSTAAQVNTIPIPTYTSFAVDGLNPIAPAEALEVLPGGELETAAAPTDNSDSVEMPVVRAFRSETVTHTVQPQDTLNKISVMYDISIDTLIKVNNIVDKNSLSVGQVLTIPPQVVTDYGTYYLIIPDSALVYGPDCVDFNIYQTVQSYGGYLLVYTQTIDDVLLSGAEIVEKVAQEYSINPRLLLALLEYQSSWVTEHTPDRDSMAYPMGYDVYGYEGLYNQLSWAANKLNEGFYYWRELEMYDLTPDGTYKFNAGTAAVQNLLFQLYDKPTWEDAIGSEGFTINFEQMFGDPFYYAYELIPANLKQPTLQLPFEPNVKWIYTGGPHDAWGTGAVWSAVDFAPTGMPACYNAEQWITAVADGVVIRSGDGTVYLDLDGDGYEQTGWVILYLHVATYEKIEEGTVVMAGDRIGHPSCEGGYATGPHIHMARKYNGEWIPAGHGDIPMVLDGWTVYSSGMAYSGMLVKGKQVIESCECNDEENMVQR